MSATSPRTLWELATCAGTENATTTFHDTYNKHRPAERPYALGFLTRGRFLRFAQSAQGHTLLEVDCSRPGAGGGGRENHIRSVCSDFFNLCVEKSKINEVQEGDYADVGAARNMRGDTYCTFPGWITAIASPAFQSMRLEWKKDSFDSPPRSTNVVVGVPVEVAVEAPASKPCPPTVVDIDSSDDDEAPPIPMAIRPRDPAARKMFADGNHHEYHKESREWTKSHAGAVEFNNFDDWVEQKWTRLSNAELEEWCLAAKKEPTPAPAPPAPPAPPASPAPAPAPTPAPKKRKRDTGPTSGTESWPEDCLGRVLIRDYDALKARGARGELAFDSSHEHRGASYAGGYTLLVTQRQLGKTAKLTDGYVILNGKAAEMARSVTRSKPKLRSVPDIVRHFNTNPDLNVILQQ